MTEMDTPRDQDVLMKPVVWAYIRLPRLSEIRGGARRVCWTVLIVRYLEKESMPLDMNLTRECSRILVKCVCRFARQSPRRQEASAHFHPKLWGELMFDRPNDVCPTLSAPGDHLSRAYHLRSIIHRNLERMAHRYPPWSYPPGPRDDIVSFPVGMGKETLRKKRYSGIQVHGQIASRLDQSVDLQLPLGICLSLEVPPHLLWRLYTMPDLPIRLESFFAEHVVYRPFGRIRQHFIRPLDSLKSSMSCQSTMIVPLSVRVEGECQGTVGLADLGLRGGFGDIEDGVKGVVVDFVSMNGGTVLR